MGLEYVYRSNIDSLFKRILTDLVIALFVLSPFLGKLVVWLHNSKILSESLFLVFTGIILILVFFYPLSVIFHQINTMVRHDLKQEQTIKKLGYLDLDETSKPDEYYVVLAPLFYAAGMFIYEIDIMGALALAQYVSLHILYRRDFTRREMFVHSEDRL